MNLQEKAQALIEKHAKRTEHMQAMPRELSRNQYLQGVRDCLEMVQGAALEDEIAQKLGTGTPALVGEK